MAWKNKEYKQFSKSINEEISSHSKSVDTKKIYSYLEIEFQNNLRTLLRKFVKQFEERKEWEDLPQNEEFFKFLENDKENLNPKQLKVYVIIRIMMMDFKFERKKIGKIMKKELNPIELSTYSSFFCRIYNQKYKKEKENNFMLGNITFSSKQCLCDEKIRINCCLLKIIETKFEEIFGKHKINLFDKPTIKITAIINNKLCFFNIKQPMEEAAPSVDLLVQGAISKDIKILGWKILHTLFWRNKQFNSKVYNTPGKSLLDYNRIQWKDIYAMNSLDKVQDITKFVHGETMNLIQSLRYLEETGRSNHTKSTVMDGIVRLIADYLEKDN